MPYACVVLGCSNRTNRETDKSFFRVPREVIKKGERTNEFTKRRRERWLLNLSLQSKGAESKNARVCSDHFVKGRPSNLYKDDDVDWAPTLNLGHDQIKSAGRKKLKERANPGEEKCKHPEDAKMLEFHKLMRLETPEPAGTRNDEQFKILRSNTHVCSQHFKKSGFSKTSFQCTNPTHFARRNVSGKLRKTGSKHGLKPETLPDHAYASVPPSESRPFRPFIMESVERTLNSLSKPSYTPAHPQLWQDVQADEKSSGSEEHVISEVQENVRVQEAPLKENDEGYPCGDTLSSLGHIIPMNQNSREVFERKIIKEEESEGKPYLSVNTSNSVGHVIDQPKEEFVQVTVKEEKNEEPEDDNYLYSGISAPAHNGQEETASPVSTRDLLKQLIAAQNSMSRQLAVLSSHITEHTLLLKDIFEDMRHQRDRKEPTSAPRRMKRAHSVDVAKASRHLYDSEKNPEIMVHTSESTPNVIRQSRCISLKSSQ